jgi:hypothetical protein
MESSAREETMEPVYRSLGALGLGVALLQGGDTTAAVQPAPGDPLRIPGAPGGENDPLGTVGLALLAYGLVQLLSKLIDKLPAFRSGGGEAPASPPAASAAPAAAGSGFSREDRKHLERVYEQAMADRQRLERLEEGVREQLLVHQRLIGQALDDLRDVHAKLDDLLRKLRALWTRVGQRKKDRG